VIEILATGPLSTVQDLGRPGYAHLGVGESGAADRASLRLANRLVGNAESAAALEVTFGGLTARFHTRTTIALTGAPCPGTIGGRPVFMSGPIEVAPGDELVLRAPTAGLRSYLAVRGGLAVPPVLGSRSTDLLAGLGPAVLAAGDRLPIGPDSLGDPCVDLAPQPELPGSWTLRISPGPRADWFAASALDRLVGGAYEVTPKSNRVGVRLSGPRLDRLVDAELPPEGMVLGALQVPPDGQPVLFLADHPVTGGYPVIAVVAEPDIALAAQARPGQTLHFRICQPSGSRDGTGGGR
jgi:biotin-dependent carboxylase-like uncharacterized protein